MWLKTIEREAEKPRPHYYSAAHFSSRMPVPGPHPHRARAEGLFRRVWAGSGAGKNELVLALLMTVGSAADPASIPFWKDTIALSRIGDQVAAKRREIAAAALAYTAIRHPDSEAFAALVALTEDPHVDAVVGAVAALIQMAFEEDLPERTRGDAADVLRRVARDARAFAPRYLARRFQLDHDGRLPEYERGNVIVFDVFFRECKRTIELEADQTLEDLHAAILDAFGWDADHLFQFSLNKDLRDQRFAFPEQAEEDAIYGLAVGAESPPQEVVPFPVGAMGLPVGHEIAYLYDFGDSHLFRIKVAGVHPKAPRATYPRVTGKVGKSPPQYGHY